MKKLKEILSSPKSNIAAFVAIVTLILVVTIGAASATVAYIAETYGTRVDMIEIGVSLLENGERISWRDYISQNNGDWDENEGTLLENMLQKGEKVHLGKAYTEKLSVRNSGTMNEYIRVVIYTYWVDEKTGVKQTSLNPNYINLHLVGLNDYWLEDVTAKTTERTVLYYNRLLKSDEETPLFSDTVTIRPDLYKYGDAYNGKKFMVEVKVDAVQEQNAQDAAASAWGRHVIINPDSGTLSLG